ncbi:nucleoside triphosphate pyrophosphohydrolase [Methanothermococcus sp.]|uniref:nucleoside triphosphate pyrophosphohydrolase n=1 Tax=Methanothermococcus sp. TaxID=2614238 RepID=UPI0026005808|nr:nucleoside triphosphate pyrophosphohydrolase [Methanothermococcus sp.]
MKKTTYNKLVRDKIPEIIKKSGHKPIVYIADDKEYINRLYDKLIEEIEEFKENPSPEELADILEVCETIGAYYRISLNEVKKIKNKKFEERGGFSKKLILKEVIKDD